MPIDPNTVLLCFVNLLLGLLLYQFKDMKDFLKSTREKIDKHTEDFAIHGFHK